MKIDFEILNDKDEITHVRGTFNDAKRRALDLIKHDNSEQEELYTLDYILNTHNVKIYRKQPRCERVIDTVADYEIVQINIAWWTPPEKETLIRAIRKAKNAPGGDIVCEHMMFSNSLTMLNSKEGTLFLYKNIRRVYHFNSWLCKDIRAYYVKSYSQ